LAAIAIGQKLAIETVRNMSYQRSDHRVPLRRIHGSTAVFFQSKLSCDVDGSPNAYHPLDDRLSLDLIEAAGGRRKGDLPDGVLLAQPDSEVVVWVNGKPYIQPDGEFKGFYVSKTTLQNPAMSPIDPTRYLDARHTQYIVLPGGMVPEAKVGDLAIVYDPVTKKLAAAVFGDIGPTSESGEAALATLQRLGMATTDGKSSPGQFRDDLFFLVFPNTASRLEQAEAWPHRQNTIDSLAMDELAKWGGVNRIEAVLRQDPYGGPVPDTPRNRAIYDELATLKKRGLVPSYEFALPLRCDEHATGRLPCAPEVVLATRAGVHAIENLLGSVELSKDPASKLDDMTDHLHKLAETYRHFPEATSAVLEGVVRETTRCSALEDRIATARKAARRSNLSARRAQHFR